MKLHSFYYILLFITLGITGCSDETTEGNLYSTEKIRIGANVMEVGNSRAYQEEGRVVNGNYNFTFLNSEGNLEIGKAIFGSNGIGYTYRDDDGEAKELEWGYVSAENTSSLTYSFFLDNLPDKFEKTTTVEFPEDPEENPYQIGVFDMENGENDLLWGSLENVSRANTLLFTLNHVMSRFCLNIYFDKSLGDQVKKPKSATITNIFQKPLSFDRLTGNFTLDEEPDPEPFFLVEEEDLWGAPTTDSENGMVYYASPDFIVPPQEFVSGNRPRLTVELTNGQVYTGLFPLAMDLIGDNNSLTPWLMSFLKGYKLTLNVIISNEPGNLQFMPASLVGWYKKGEYNISGLQASIANEDDFKKLEAECGKQVTDLFYLWGYHDSNTDKWIINVFQTFTIKASDYSGVWKNLKSEEIPFDFDFDLHYATVIVTNGGDKINLTKSNGGEEKLKRLLLYGEVPSE